MLNSVKLSIGQKVLINDLFGDLANDIQKKYNLIGETVEIVDLKYSHAEETYVSNDNEPTFCHTYGATKLKLSSGEIISIDDHFQEGYWAFFTSETPEVFRVINNV